MTDFDFSAAGLRSAAVLMFLFGGQPVLAQTVTADLERGRALAVENCSPCHGIGATDGSKADGAPVFRELSAKYPIEHLEESLAEGIVTGHEAMPEIELNPVDLSAFIGYLQSIQVQ